jgi:uncharacterized delta-60 repeat protein
VFGHLNNFAIARLNTDGTLDGTFGSGGMVVTDFNNVEDNASSVVIQPDGKIVVGGSRETFEPHSTAFALARYNSNGSLDTAFGSGGKVVTDFEEGHSEDVQYLFLQADGKILAVGNLYGYVTRALQHEIVLARYNSNGTADSTFGNNGKFRIYFDRIATYLGGAELQPDGKILISGTYMFNDPNCIPGKAGGCNGTQHFLLRYNQRMVPDRKFGRLGKAVSQDFFGELSLLANGDILASGRMGFHTRSYTNNGWLKTVFERVVFPNNNEALVTTNPKLTQGPNGTIAGCQPVGMEYSNHDFGVFLFDVDGRLIGIDKRDFFGAGDGCRTVLFQPDGKILAVGSAQLEQMGDSSFAVLRYLNITP